MSSPDGVPHIVPMKKLSNQHRCPDALSNVYTTLSFMNRTKEHVVVAYNYGVTQSVPPLPKPIHPYENENFVIRRTLTMSTIHAIRGMEAAIINMRNSCGTLNQENEYILKTILESLERDPRLSCLTVIFDFELTMEDLTENTVSYIPEVDLQVTMYGSVLKSTRTPAVARASSSKISVVRKPTCCSLASRSTSLIMHRSSKFGSSSRRNASSKSRQTRISPKKTASTLPLSGLVVMAYW